MTKKLPSSVLFVSQYYPHIVIDFEIRNVPNGRRCFSNTLREGNVFTHVCNSVYRGCIHPTMQWGRR